MIDPKDVEDTINEKPVATFTQEEVSAMLETQKNDLREVMAEKMAEKNRALAGLGQDQFFDLTKWEVMRKMAADMVLSKALPATDNAYTVMVKMQAGREMGMKPMESIKSFYIVNGVLNIYGDAVVRRLREHGWTLLPYKEAHNTCTATIKKGEEEYSETLTFEDAQKSGWTGTNDKLKPGWIDGINRRRKLRYGAISTLIKTYIPEVLGAAVDIKEVAEDTIPVIEGKMQESESRPATEEQLNVLKQLDKQVSWEETNFTHAEAAERIKSLTAKKGKAK